jgi:1,4-alpha-glucan branching enzyme
MFAHPGKKLLFMGGELGQPADWDPDGQLEWELLEKPEHASLQRLVRDLNRLHAAEPALHESDFTPRGFEWIDFRDEARSVLAFLRRGQDPDDFVIVVANGSPVPLDDHRIGIPVPGRYRQILNTDAVRYGGSGFGVARTIEASPEPAMRRPYSLVLSIPPLGIVFLKPERSRGRPPRKSRRARAPRRRERTRRRSARARDRRDDRSRNSPARRASV